MKKAFLLFVAAILISASSHGQWYHKQYGVSDIDQLSHQQLNEALRKAKNGTATGAVISALGVIGIVSGVLIINDSSDELGNIGKSLGGGALVAISIPLEITGLVILGVNRSRVISIKEALENVEIKIGFFNSPKSLISPHCPVMTGLSVSFQFHSSFIR